MKILFFDTETTGLPKDRKYPAEKHKDNWPDIVSISWMLFEDEQMISTRSYIVKPDGWNIPIEATNIHGITEKSASTNGQQLSLVIADFIAAVRQSEYIVAHNIHFDLNVVNNACFWRLNRTLQVDWKECICTAEYGKDVTKIYAKNARGGSYFRYPKLSELYEHVLRRRPMLSLHNSLNDTMLLCEVFFHLPIYQAILGKESVQKNGTEIQTAPPSRLRLDLSASD